MSTAAQTSLAESIEQVRALGVLPVVELDTVDDAEPLLAALSAGGLPAAEITLRTASLCCCRSSSSPRTCRPPQQTSGPSKPTRSALPDRQHRRSRQTGRRRTRVRPSREVGMPWVRRQADAPDARVVTVEVEPSAAQSCALVVRFVAQR